MTLWGFFAMIFLWLFIEWFFGTRKKKEAGFWGTEQYYDSGGKFPTREEWDKMGTILNEDKSKK